MLRLANLPLILLLAAGPALVPGTPLSPEQKEKVQTRTYARTAAECFGQALERLLANNYIIRFADPNLGLITFYTQGEEARSNRKHLNLVEGTLLLKALSPKDLSVRAKLTVRWMESVGDTNFSFGVQQDAEAAYYDGLFKLLEAK